MLLDQPVKKEYQLPFINGSDRERRNGMDKSYVYHPSVYLLDKVWWWWCVCVCVLQFLTFFLSQFSFVANRKIRNGNRQ